MRLFFYYTFHTFINTIKKVLKTWVAVMLACLVVGVLIGLGISAISPKSDKDKDKKDTEVSVVVGEDGETVVSPDGTEETSAKKHKLPGFLTERGKTANDLVGLIISAVFFLTLAMNISNAKSSGKIFKPADVPMLFASPMKPQSVLMFRLIGTPAMSLFLSIYMLFQLPNLIYNAGFTTWGAISAGHILHGNEQNKARNIRAVHICHHRIFHYCRCFCSIRNGHRQRLAHGCL